jgi:hypothetical protein
MFSGLKSRWQQRSAAVGAVLGEHAELAVRIAEYHQVLADQARFHRGAVFFRHFVRQAHRQPVAAHDAAHRRIAFDAAEELVLFRGQHVLAPRKDILRYLSI